jgi:CRISPR-associated protein Csy3
MTKEKIKLPSVLAFEKKLVPSDGYFYGTKWSEINFDNLQEIKKQPLRIELKRLRGTMSHQPKNNSNNVDKLKEDTNLQDANLQMIEACSLNENQDTLNMHFTLKILSGLEQPWVSNGKEFNILYPQIIIKYREKFGFKELAKRYGLNIANARYLWRNRVGVENIKVLVKINNHENILKFDAKKFDLKNFDYQPEGDLKILIDHIANALAGTNEYEHNALILDINVFAKVGIAQDVYPSQEFVKQEKNPSRNEEKVSKVLYKIKLDEAKEIAGMHSQKIGNALRTIDSWYPEPNDNDNNPIAIEPYGQVTTRNMVYRDTPNDFYTLIKKIILDSKELRLDSKFNEKEYEKNLHYIVAVLIRGGVFSEKKDDKKNNDSTEE